MTLEQRIDIETELDWAISVFSPSLTLDSEAIKTAARQAIKDFSAYPESLQDYFPLYALERLVKANDDADVLRLSRSVWQISKDVLADLP